MPRAVAVLLLALMVTAPAVASGDGARVEFQVVYGERSVEYAADGYLAEGTERSFRVVVTDPNVTRVEAILRWSESHDASGLSRPDVFRLALFSPDGAPAPGSPARSDKGAVTLAVTGINPIPVGGPADAASARDMLQREGRAGTGAWVLHVRHEDAGNPPGMPLDAGNTYDVVLVVTTYEGVAMRVVSLEPPSPLSALARDPWPYATIALLGVAVALTVILAMDARRRARARQRVEVVGARELSRNE